ncbi:pyridoxamine 5'-phosphate oxidase family protein [Micromonospora sp. CPCC 206060]|uniref:pyridoxamine 5'-phosphate oxidase family protein n=1 Tax=Micromonospora sp. CPCC 206060 TaxID=3122406 RepID=UPI002FF19DA3
MDDRRILQELSRHEALRLLAGVAMGRVVFTQRALPAIRPVNHILDNGDVIIRTNLASSVAANVDRRPGTVVAYEADVIDPDTRTGWSVVVTGVAHLVDNPRDQARYEALLRPWVSNPADCVLRIRPDIVTGFRLTPQPA